MSRGSRQIEREAIATKTEIEAMFGKLSNEVISEILALRPTLADLDEVAAWGRNEDAMIIYLAIRNLVSQRRYATY